MITWHNLSFEGDKKNSSVEDRRTKGEKHNPVMRHLRSQQALLDSTLIHWDYRVQSQADALEFSELEEERLD
jgi:hypothetical protein